MRAQRHEPVRLDPATAPQHPHDRGLQVVIADQVKYPAIPFQRADVPLQERLLGLVPERDHERGPGEARAHLEQVHLDHLPAQRAPSPPPVDLGLHTRVADQRHEHLADHRPARGAWRARTGRPAAQTPPRRAQRRAAARSAEQCDAACAAPPDPAFKPSRRSPPDTPPASAPADPPARASAAATADSNACLTARRCTPWRLANSLTDSPSRA